MNTLFTTICAVSLLFISTVHVQAQTATPSPQPTTQTATEKLSDQINNLKEKIASRVAQLKLVEKRGLIGSVKEVSGTQLTVSDITIRNRIIDVDEITKFSSPSAKDSFGISDLKAGAKVSVVGLYNKDSERLLARFIDVVSVPTFISGTISGIDHEAFTVNVAMEEGKSYLVDIETVTRTTLYTDTTPEKAGFSKLEVGNRIVVVGYPDVREKDRMVATRILAFPSLPKNPNVVIAPSAVSEKGVSSTGSGKKLTPLTKPR